MSGKRVVVTGIGPIASVGTGKDRFWQGILNKRLNLKTIREVIDGKTWAEFPAHMVDGFNINSFGIDKDRLNDIKEWKEGEEVIDLNYILAAIKLGLDDSKFDYTDEDNGLGLVLAHENLGLMPFGYKVSSLAYDMLIGKSREGISKKDFFDSFYKRFLKSGYDVQTFADLYHVARVFNVRNYSLFINNACASGLYAFEAASQIIKSGQAKIVAVASSDHPDAYKYLWFKGLGIYADDGVIKPFSKDSKGLVFGDGGVSVILEEYASAQKRKAPIYAEYAGGGFDLEGWKITVPQIGSQSYQRAIASAFQQNEVRKDEIDLLCPHGVGSAPIDFYEAKAITDTFGENPKKPLITTFKPYVGHSLGASALLEAAILLLAQKNNIIPPVLNTTEVDPRFNITLVKEKKEAKLETVMKICCAFAGYNAAAIFRKAA